MIAGSISDEESMGLQDWGSLWNKGKGKGKDDSKVYILSDRHQISKETEGKQISQHSHIAPKILSLEL